MFEAIEKNFRHVQWKLTLIFSACFLLVIVFYSLLLLRAHDWARYSFEQNVRRELSLQDLDAPLLPGRVACAPPSKPYRATPTTEDMDLTELIIHNFDRFVRRFRWNLWLFDLLIWLSVSCGGYFFIGWLLKPARAAAAAQEEFLANASHELKTPITTIKTELSLLEGEKMSRDARECVTAITTENNALAATVEKLLQLLRHEKRLRLTGKCEVWPLTQRLIKRAARTWSAKKLEFRVTGVRGACLMAPETVVSEILELLLDNAAKYADDDSLVSVEISADKFVSVRVINCGVGIPETARAQIWERFFRVTDKRIQAETGSGLGLAIAKQLAQDADLSLTLESGAPERTVFCLRGKRGTEHKKLTLT